MYPDEDNESDDYREFGDQDNDEEDEDYPDHLDEEDSDENRSEFADPGGNSSLRAATASNPRNLPCPECEEPNRLTPADKAHGYRCNECADRAEGGGY